MINDNDNRINNDNSQNNAEAENNKGADFAGQNTTYHSTYTPANDGYTRTTGEAQNNGSGYNAHWGNPDNRSGFGGYGNIPTPQKKKSSKAGIVAIVLCAVLLLGFAFTLVGFSIASMSIFKNRAETITDLETDLSHGANFPESADASLETEAVAKPDENNNATITKTPGGSVTTIEGKVGELMEKHQVANLVKDSVVEITTEQVVKGHSFHQYVQSGAGSGVIIAKEGHVITNNHVINGASKITVRLTNGNEYEAKLIGTDASSDIAVLKISPDEELTVATLGASSKLSIAEEVIVIGNPLGELGGTVTNGIVSALAREITIDGENMTLIQTNAAVNPGNSGGGMFNLYGELVGIVNAKSSGSDVEGLGFAIPVDTAYDIVLQLMDYGYVRGRVDHGLDLIDIGDLFTAASYRVSSLGVYVYESKYTDAIKNGDRIASINGKEVSTSAGVKEALSGCKVGETVDVTVVRGGKFYEVKLTLKEYVPEKSNGVSFE